MHAIARLYMRSKSLGVGGTLMLGAMSVQAADAPTSGLLYNTSESHSMVYRCRLDQSTSLECEFTQTAVRKKAKPAELGQKLKQAREEFRGATEIPEEQCPEWKEVVDVLEGRKKPPRSARLNEMPTIQRKEVLAMTKAFSEFCTTKSVESFLKVVRLGHEKDVRTCLVSAHVFKQSFRFVQDDLSGKGSWVARGSPDGPCGIVELSRFEPESPKGKLVFWNYIARKAVTNPEGSFAPGVSCKGLDESGYLYGWKSKEHALGCDYIEFSPL